MKKLVTVFLTLALGLSLGACSELKDIDLPPLPTVTPENDSIPQETAVPATEAPAEEDDETQIIVTMQRSVQQAYDPENGSHLILSFSYDTPNIYIEGKEEAAAKINERIAMMEEAYYTGNDYGDGAGTGYNNMLTMAEDNYNYVVGAGIEGAMLELVSSRTVSIERIDSQVLTLLYNDYTFTGGAHGTHGSDGYCYDVSTGELLSLDDLSADVEGLRNFLVDYMVQAVENDEELAARIELMGLTLEETSYADVLTPLLRQGSWYFTNEGMVIFSDTYEISSYAEGPVAFAISYDELKDHIDEKWLPKAVDGTGSLHVLSAAEMVDGSTKIIDKLVADEDGQQFYLIADGSVYNVRISKGDYSQSFYETAQLWACNSMENCAIQLGAVIPDGLPDLEIRYDDAGGEHVLYLTHSGEDGSVILTETVEAVG